MQLMHRLQLLGEQVRERGTKDRLIAVRRGKRDTLLMRCLWVSQYT